MSPVDPPLAVDEAGQDLRATDVDADDELGYSGHGGLP
jgi:hypothetical protein